MFCADHDDCPELPDAAERVDGDVRTARPVAHVLTEDFFTAVGCEQAGFDGDERHPLPLSGFDLTLAWFGKKPLELNSAILASAPVAQTAK